MSVMRMEIKLQPQFVSSIYCHFMQNQTKHFTQGWHLKTCPKTWSQVVFCFLIFYFFRYLKAFYINYINSNSITKHITL